MVCSFASYNVKDHIFKSKDKNHHTVNVNIQLGLAWVVLHCSTLGS